MSIAAAVVGTGFIGPVHVEALRRAGVTVRGVLGSTAEKSRTAADALGLLIGYPTFDEILADDAVDVVHLATPNRLHYLQATAALKAGKHVLCEKPLAMNSRESSELVRLAEETGLAAGVAYNIRFYPLCHDAAARVKDGSVGHVHHINGSYTQDWLLHESDFNWRVVAADGGELRAVGDIGTHWLDLVQFISGQRVVAVCSDLQIVHTERTCSPGGAETFSNAAVDQTTERVEVTTEDAACVLLKFANGARGSLHVSQTTAGRKNALHFDLAGSRQTLSWRSERPNAMWIGHRDRPNEELLRDPALMSGSSSSIASYPGGHNEGFPDTFKQLFREFYRYVALGDASAPRAFPTFADGHYEILLCEAILESHRRRCWIDVNA